MFSNYWRNYQIMTDLLCEDTDYNDLTYKEYATSRINNKNESGIKQSDFLCCNVHANKAFQNTREQNKVGGEVITGENILHRLGRLYYDRGRLYYARGETFSWGRETILRLYVTPAGLAAGILIIDIN